MLSDPILTGTGGRRLILRAELVRGGRRSLAHTLQVSPTAAFIQTDELLELEEKVNILLSFPRLLAPLELIGVVIGRKAAQGHGEPHGVLLSFRSSAEEARERLRAILDAVETAGEPKASEAAAPASQPLRILLVEDNAMIRDMFTYGVSKYFRQQRRTVAVDFAGDGQEAWRMLQDGAYDLAIVDYYLPVMTGSELVRRVRHDSRLAQMPIIAISVGGAEAREAFFQAGADLYLDKPVVIRDLFTTLERLSAGSHAP